MLAPAVRLLALHWLRPPGRVSNSVTAHKPYCWTASTLFRVIKAGPGATRVKTLQHVAREKGRAGNSPARPRGLETGDVLGLQALGAFADLEFNRLAFVQRLVPLRLDGGKVDENVLAGLALDEPESLAGVEPLHCSLFFHCFSFSMFKLFGATRTPPAVKQKGCKCGLAAPLNESKDFTRATNAALD